MLAGAAAMLANAPLPKARSGASEAPGTVRIVSMPFRSGPVRTRASYLARQAPDSAGPLVASALMDGLTTVAPDGTIAPALAARWFPADHARKWVFSLREGIPAERVAEQLRVLTASKNAYRTSTRSLETSTLIERYEVLSARALRVDCTRPAPELPWIVSRTMFRVPLTSSRTGTSPFEFLSAHDAHSPEDCELRLVAREPSPAGRALRAPQARQLRITFSSSPETRVAQVLSGDADIALGVQGLDPAVLARAREAGLRVLRSRTEWLPAVVPRRGGWPASDPGLLGALRDALDREALCNQAYAGHGTPGADHPFIEDASQHLLCPERPAPGAGAQRTLEMRWSHPQHERLAKAMAAQWRARAGLSVTLVQASPWTPARDGLDLLPIDLVFSVAGTLILHLDDRWSPSGWDPGPAGQRLIELAHGALDARSRGAVLRSAARILACMGPYIIPVVPERLDIAHPGIVLGTDPPSPDRPLSMDRFVADIGPAG